MNRRRQLALTAATLGLPTLAGWGLTGCAQRDAAPDLPYTLLDGRSSRIGALQGKVVLVNFWATSCTTCVHEMPQLMSTHEKYQARGYETLAVAMSYDPPEYVANFRDSRKLPFSVAHDASGALAKGFGEVRLTPTSVLLDKRGGVVKRYVGEPDFPALHKLIEELLAA